MEFNIEIRNFDIGLVINRVPYSAIELNANGTKAEQRQYTGVSSLRTEGSSGKMIRLINFHFFWLRLYIGII